MAGKQDLKLSAQVITYARAWGETRGKIQLYEQDDSGMSVRTRTDQLLAQIITYARVVGLPVSERKVVLARADLEVSGELGEYQ